MQLKRRPQHRDGEQRGENGKIAKKHGHRQEKCAKKSLRAIILAQVSVVW